MSKGSGIIVALAFLAFHSAFFPLFADDAKTASAADIVLHTTVRGDQNHSYIELPFDVPSGVSRITVTFTYTGKEERTTLDLGILDPQGFRGWSGGNKDTFTLGASDATPSYLPGDIVPGRWKLLIGVPNIRPQSMSVAEAKIYFARANVGMNGFTDPPLETRARWYRGDLHMHTGHSDGRCASQSGKEVACPVFMTLQAAAKRGLDFVAITDHNTSSQFNSLRELQPYFDRLLLLPGREITTFQGHANIFGITDFVDFRVGSRSVPRIDAFLENATRLGALVSINHPGLPSGESCMGCGWRPEDQVDMHRVAAIEVVNGAIPEGPLSGLKLWEEQLRDGLRPTAIGGSDNHRPELSLEKPGSLGSPTTVVYAQELSVPAILRAIKAGHVFIDLTGSRDRLLEFSASSGGTLATAGDALTAPSGAIVQITTHIVGCAGSSAGFLLDGRVNSAMPAMLINHSDETLRFSWTGDGKIHWLRAEVRAADGAPQLLGNPIYINFPNPVDEPGATSSSH